MNRLIIIGNGFDLAHGLKTSYADFLLDFLKTALNKVSAEGQYKDELIEISIKSSKSLIYFSENDFISNSQTCSELIKISEKLGANFNYIGDFSRNIFLNIQNKNWVDIENHYYYELKRYLNKDFGTPNSLNKQVTYLKGALINYIKKESDLFNQKPKISTSIQSLFLDNMRENIDEVNSHDFEKSDTIYQTMILNFNYTDVISKYFSNPKRFLLNNIHGNVSDKESIVFGFGDELDKYYQEMEDLNDNMFFEHIKSFKYFQNKSYQELISFIGSMRFEVYVMGHSLGLSDRTMLSQIFESRKLERVKLFYYKRPDGTNDYIEKAYEISRHFENKGRMREKIVPFTESKPMPQL